MSIWTTSFDLAELNAQRAHTLLEGLDIRFSAFGDDWLAATMPVDDRTHQPYGLLHGGASVALAETVGSTAAALTTDMDNQIVVGLSINASHLHAVRNGLVTGTAKPVHLGRHTQVWEIRVTADPETLVCMVRLTMAVLPRKSSLSPDHANRG